MFRILYALLYIYAGWSSENMARSYPAQHTPLRGAFGGQDLVTPFGHPIPKLLLCFTYQLLNILFTDLILKSYSLIQSL